MLLLATGALPLERSDVAWTGAADAQAPPTVASAWNGQAPCLGPPRLNARTIKAKLARLAAGAPRVSDAVAGFRIEDEPQPLVDALRRLAPTPTAAARPPPCAKALCAVSTLFGPETGPKLLYLLVRYGYNGSPLATASKAWEPDELDLLLAAFADLPANLLPFDDAVRIVTHDHGAALVESSDRDPMDDIPLAASGGAAGGIRIGDGWHVAQAAERRASILHELAHQFAAAREAHFDWRSTWLGAMQADRDWARQTGQRTSFVSDYAERNLDEDFAESATAYRYMPALLGMRAPHRYALLKDWMFDGLEYHSADQCRPTRARSEQARLVAEMADR